VDLIKSHFKIADQERGVDLVERVEVNLRTMDEALKQEVLPAVLFLLDALPPGHPFAAIDPRERQHRIETAVKQLLVWESRLQPVCLIVEDLQWIDVQSQAVLNCLSEMLPSSRILILVTYRPDYRHSWVARSYYR